MAAFGVHENLCRSSSCEGALPWCSRSEWSYRSRNFASTLTRSRGSYNDLGDRQSHDLEQGQESYDCNEERRSQDTSRDVRCE